MSIVGGLDIHRKRLTFDYVDTVTGELSRGQVMPADREHLAGWLRRIDGEGEMAFAVEACTGWRYVVEELARAGVATYPAEPAETAAARGPKKRAKTARTPSCCASCSSMAGCRNAGFRRRWCWSVGRCWSFTTICAVNTHRVGTTNPRSPFPSGRTGLGQKGVDNHRQRLPEIAAKHLSPAGRVQIDVALAMLETLDTQLDALRRQLVTTARHLRGAKTLADAVYGVGPITALALCCWLGGANRSGSSRKAVRFVGLDVTEYSSAGKRGPGHLSRQGPSLLRWCLYEAAKTSARPAAPEHRYYDQIRDRIDGKRAARPQARRIVRKACHLLTNLGDEAFAKI